MKLVLEACLANALVACLLAACAWAFGRRARRPALTHTLWVLVLLKLLTPPLVGIPIPWPAAAEPGQRVLAPPPAGLADPAAVADFEAALRLDGVTAAIMEDPVDLVDAAPAGKSRWSFSVPDLSALRPLMLGLWLAGAVAWFGWAAWRIRRFQQLLGCAQLAPDYLQQEAAALAGRIGLPGAPQVWLVPVSVSPLLWALGGPARLVLPAGLLKALRPDERGSLLAHELAHLKRRDHWVRWLELAVTGLYWWHPVVWWARREIELAEEACCDAWVVWSLPGTALAYAQTLLKTVDYLSEPRLALPPSASGAGQVHTLRRRVTMILHQPIPHRLSWPARAGALALALAVLPLAPMRLAAQEKDDPAPRDRAARPAEGDRKQGPSDDRMADLSARLRQLERRLDELSRSLERRGDSRAEPRREAERPARSERREAERAERSERREEARSARREADQKRREADQKRRETDQKRRDLERERRDADRETRGDVEDLKRSLRESIEKEVDVDALKKRMQEFGESVRKTFDIDRIDKLAKEYKEAMRDETNPERREQIERKFHEALKKSIDPERIEKFAKETEESIRKALDPEQLENIQRKIEESLKKAIDPEKVEKAKREFLGKLDKQLEVANKELREAADKEAAKKAKSATAGKGKEEKAEKRAEKGKAEPKPSEEARRKTDREARELDQRLRQLEQQLQRLQRQLDRRPSTDL